MNEQQQVPDDQKIITQTKSWIEKVVIGLNLCPFAGREFRRGAIHYKVVNSSDRKEILTQLAFEFQRLNENVDIETTLIILPGQFPDFYDYLDIIDLCEQLLDEEDYEGIYQIASFHPSYLFNGSTENDASNFTNRSPYPMIHILREASITQVYEKYIDPEKIPERNIAVTNEKGLEMMRELWRSCF